MDGKGLATEEEAETAVGAWGGQQNAGGDGVVYAGDWSGIATRGCYDRREQNREGHLCGRRQGRSGGEPWGKNRGKGEGSRPTGKPGRRVLCSGRRRRGRQAYGVATKPSGVSGYGGVREAYGVSENPRGTAREWEEESSRRRASTPPEWKSFPGGTKPPEWPPRKREFRGKTDGGGEGK